MPSHQPDDRFVGRRLELERVVHALDAPGSLVAIVGPPGVGKSSLLWHTLATHHADAPALDLTAHQSARGALVALMGALKVPPPPRGPQLDQEQLVDLLAEAITARELTLLALDNTEHLLPFVESLHAALRHHGATTSLLIGTRKTANNAVNIELEPFSAEHAPGEILAIFHAHAPSRVRAKLTASMEEELIELGRLLEGLPLSITLAASRLGMLKPSQMIERFERAPGEDATLASLQEAMTWSWELLSESERDALMICAHFRDGFCLEDAESLMTKLGLDGGLDHLGALEAHSLIAVRDAGEVFRGRMLESIRLFALARSMERASVHDARRDAHARLMAEIAIQRHDACSGRYWEEDAAALAMERANLELALGRLLEQPDAHLEPMLSLSIGLHLVYRILADAIASEQMFKKLEQLVEARRDAIDPNLLARYELARADFAGMRWDASSASVHITRALERATSPQLILNAHVGGADQTSAFGHEATLTHIDEGMALARELGDDHAMVELLLLHGNLLTRENRLVEALARHEEALTILEKHPDRVRQTARAKLFTGFTLRAMRELTRCEALMLDSIEAFRRLNDPVSLGHALRVTAWYAIEERREALVESTLGELMELANKHSLRWLKGTAHFLMGQLLLDREDLTRAIVSYERAILHLETQGVVPFLTAARLYCTLALLLERREDRARAMFALGLEKIDTLRSAMAHVNYRCVEAYFLREEDSKRAREILDKAFEHQEEFGINEEAMLTLYHCHIDLIEYLAAVSAKKPRKSKKLLATLTDRLTGLLTPREDGERPLVEVSAELRIGWKLLERDLPEEILRRFDIGLEDPNNKALLVDTRARAFRPPGDTSWVDMSKRETPFRLLQTLVDHRLDAPGEPIDPDSLFEHVWPDESILPDAAQNRLYVTIAALRREGLKQVILNQNGGYYLDPQVRLLGV